MVSGFEGTEANRFLRKSPTQSTYNEAMGAGQFVCVSVFDAKT